MFQFLLLFFFLNAAANAAGIDVVELPEGAVIRSDNCEILKTQRAALQIWKHRFPDDENPPDAAELECKKLPNGSAQLSIEDAVPKRIKDLWGFCPRNEGPNCWNSALFMNHIVPALRYSTPKEMTFWMESPLCQKLGPDDKPRPGDIIAIRDKSGHEVHGFLYLSQELCFSKNGSLSLMPYGLFDTKFVFSAYGVSEECSKHPVPKTARCSLKAQYFHCTPLAEYLKDKPELAQKYACFDKPLTALEKSQSKKVLNESSHGLTFSRDQTTNKPIVHDVRKEFCASMNALKQDLCDISKARGKDFPKSCGDRFLDKSFDQRTQSIIEQAELVSPPSKKSH